MEKWKIGNGHEAPGSGIRSWEGGEFLSRERITRLRVSTSAVKLFIMKHDDLPARWKAKVAEWVSRLGHSNDGRFSAMDFPYSHSVDITFDDGSKASFRYAILIEAPELNEIGVFTEHCGYHVFPLSGTHVARMEL